MWIFGVFRERKQTLFRGLAPYSYCLAVIIRTDEAVKYTGERERRNSKNCSRQGIKLSSTVTTWTRTEDLGKWRVI